MTQVWNRIRSRPKTIGAVIFWIIVLSAMRQYMQVNNLTFGELTNQLAILLTGTWYGPLLYIIVYIFRPLILFPASLLTLLGGNVFGLFPGSLIVLVAGTLSSIIPYAAGLSLSSVNTNTTQPEGRLQRFVSMLQDNPFQAVLIMRLLYLPYDAVSILAGSLRINFVIFLVATAIGNIGGTLAYVGIGSSIQGDISSGDISLDANILLFSLVVLVIGLVVSRMINQFTVKQTPQQDSTK